MMPTNPFDDAISDSEDNLDAQYDSEDTAQDSEDFELDDDIQSQEDDLEDAEPSPELTKDQKRLLGKTGKEQVPNKKKPDRFEYWQAEATKYKEQVDQLTPWMPVIRHLSSNPQALQQILQPQAGAKTLGEPPAPTPEKPVKPEKPAKPANFSRLEAEEDPNSPSAKYLAELDGYQEKIIDYHEKVAESRERKLAAIEQAAEQQRAQVNQFNQGVAYVMQNFRMSRAEAEEVMAKLYDPATITFDSLVGLVANQNKQTADPDSIKRDIQNRRQLNSTMYPTPPGAAPGAGRQTTITDEDAFNLSLFSAGQGRGRPLSDYTPKKKRR